MIEYKEGNIFDSTCDVLVNTVNCKGVMGKGLALQFKNYYKDTKYFYNYVDDCKHNMYNGGTIRLYRFDTDLFAGKQYKDVLNFATKEHWLNKSKVEWIQLGLINFCIKYKKLGITSIAFPKLGCTNGGLDWETQVKPLMELYLSKLPIKIEIYV